MTLFYYVCLYEDFCDFIGRLAFFLPVCVNKQTKCSNEQIKDLKSHIWVSIILQMITKIMFKYPLVELQLLCIWPWRRGRAVDL